MISRRIVLRALPVIALSTAWSACQNGSRGAADVRLASAELREQFNAGVGKTRVLMLVAPT